MSQTTIIKNVEAQALSSTQLTRKFKQLLAEGYQLQLTGMARNKPAGYLPRTRPPRHLITLFGVDYFLSDIRRDDGFRYFVAYLAMPQLGAHRKRIYPRIFYKDSSLIWRSASHIIKSEHEHWVGKGDCKPVREDGEINWYSAEETTNLPFEIDAALDAVSRRADSVTVDNDGLPMVLRNAPDGRVSPYADFSRPRKQAMSVANQRIYNSKNVAWFNQPDKPQSLEFAKGFEPNFQDGLIDCSDSWSKIYGGAIEKYRFASTNQKIQYMLVVGPNQVWIIPPQPLDKNIMSYGVRSVDANVEEDLCVPGFEFHYLEDEDDPDSWYSQIPEGFAGAPSDIDPDRADASPWIEKLPVIKEFRRYLKAGHFNGSN